MTQSKVGVGIVGVGNISGIYLENIQKSDLCKVTYCADLDADRAKAVADKHSVPNSGLPEALFASSDVDVVLNLTVPNAHYAIAKAALDSGKHVYNEKPLSVSLPEAKLLLETANSKNLRVGCAPDTFFGAAHQTCREFIDKGNLGVIAGAMAFMMGGGHEHWHPNPEFFYKPGGGPMLDMGPYYMTALVQLLGPIKRATGFTRITNPTRTVTSEPFKGHVIHVETPTHIAGSYEFASGPIAQVTMSFDVPVHFLPHILIFGSEGTLQVSDPNNFGGEPTFRKRGSQDWEMLEVNRPYSENSRGVGLIDMVDAIQSGRPHRASGALALHVLEAMLAPEKASQSGETVEFTTTVERSAPL